MRVLKVIASVGVVLLIMYIIIATVMLIPLALNDAFSMSSCSAMQEVWATDVENIGILMLVMWPCFSILYLLPEHSKASVWLEKRVVNSVDGFGMIFTGMLKVLGISKLVKYLRMKLNQIPESFWLYLAISIIVILLGIGFVITIITDQCA